VIEKQETQIQTAVRLPESLLKRIDELVKSMSQSQPGMHVTRTDAMRHALFLGVAQLEETHRSGKKKR
jgi:Arc/MetJ-type ribon-helix-helix transcriptional regulator